MKSKEAQNVQANGKTELSLWASVWSVMRLLHDHGCDNGDN